MVRQQNKPGPEELGYAASLYDASASLDDIQSGVAGRGPIGFTELYRYAVDPECRPDAALAGALAHDSRIRADFAAMVQNAAIAAIPQAAAAADETGIEERAVNGWRVLLRPVHANPDQVWVIVEYADKTIDLPRIIYAGDVRQPLPESRDGRFQFRLDAESDLIKGLQDINSEVFLV
jgi:hypothetical protein